MLCEFGLAALFRLKRQNRAALTSAEQVVTQSDDLSARRQRIKPRPARDVGALRHDKNTLAQLQRATRNVLAVHLSLRLR